MCEGCSYSQDLAPSSSTSVSTPSSTDSFISTDIISASLSFWVLSPILLFLPLYISGVSRSESTVNCNVSLTLDRFGRRSASLAGLCGGCTRGTQLPLHIFGVVGSTVLRPYSCVSPPAHPPSTFRPHQQQYWGILFLFGSPTILMFILSET